MLKLCLTLLLLGVFLGQGDAIKCYSCVGDSAAIPPVTCETKDTADTSEIDTDDDNPFCYVSKDGSSGSDVVTRGRTAASICGKVDTATLVGDVFTCDTDLCNGGDFSTEKPKPADCPKACPKPTECPAGNSATKSNRGFGVIMTSVSLSYVITKFL